MKVCLKTSGCTYNRADSDALASVLEARGVTLASERESDVVVYNTCSVKQNTQDKLLSSISRCAKPLVVTGCLSQASPELVRAAKPSAVLLPIESQGSILAAVESALRKKPIVFASALARGVRVDTGVARVRIANGCAGACSYCLTRLARGKLASRPIPEITREVNEAAARGAVEIQLCGQDAGAYGLDSGSSLGELLDAASALPGAFKLRVGMLNPNHASPSLWRHYNEKTFKFLHLPLQSASDSVLEAMNRGYAYADYARVLRSFERAFPEGLVATDIIVGYPTETRDDFQRTLDAIGELRFGCVNVSKYSSRPGTPAALLPRLPTREVKARSTEASRLALRVVRERNKEFLGRTLECLVTEPARRGGWICRTEGYWPLLVRSAHPGERLLCRVEKARGVHLEARKIKVLKQSPA